MSNRWKIDAAEWKLHFTINDEKNLKIWFYSNIANVLLALHLIRQQNRFIMRCSLPPLTTHIENGSKRLVYTFFYQIFSFESARFKNASNFDLFFIYLKTKIYFFNIFQIFLHKWTLHTLIPWFDTQNST